MGLGTSNTTGGLNAKLRVVHFRDLWLALTENWIFNQIKFADSRIESHVICERSDNLNQFGLLNIHQISRPTYIDRFFRLLHKLLRQPPYSRRLLKKISEVNPAIIHSHFGNFAWLEMPIARRLNSAHIVTFYGYDVNRLPQEFPVWQERYKVLFEHIDKVLCEGSHMAGDIIRRGCPPNKVLIHHLGIALDDFSFQPRKWEEGTPLRILMSGNFVEKKGMPYALKALGRIKQQVPLEITIIGDAKNQPRCIAEKEKIIKAVMESDLSSSTRMLGFQPHAVLLKEAYNHHIFISPSITSSDGDTEGGVPVTIIEMAATGMPVVSTNHCDIPEVITDGKSGFLAPEKDVASLTEKIQILIEQKNNWLPFLDEARRHIEQEYNAETQGIKLSKVYFDVVEQKKSLPASV